MITEVFKYFYEILKHARRGQQLFLNIRDVAKNFINLAEEFEKEELLIGEKENLIILKPQEQRLEEGTKEDGTLFPNSNEELPKRNKASIFDRLLHLYDYFLNNPYEYEILYCYLFVVGMTEENKEVFAPLFIVPATVEYSKAGLKVTLAEDNIRLNSFALTQLYPETVSQHFAEFISLEDSSVPLSINRVNDALKKITNIHPSIAHYQILSNHFEDLPISKLVKGKFRIYNSAGLALTKKDNVYIINDLKHLATMPSEHFADTALKILLETPEDSEKNDETPSRHMQFLFPFANNPPQRKVVQKAEACDLVVVQGPPGTGKSQTISNIICDLVANGKSVLVSSQKNKALEVVSEKYLDSLHIPYLHTTILKDDKTSKKKLKETVDSIASEIHTEDPKWYERTWQRELKRLTDIDNNLSKLKQEFNYSCTFERKKLDKFQRTIGELTKRYCDIKQWNVLDKDETLNFSQHNEVERVFDEYFKLLDSFKREYRELEQLTQDNKLPDTERETSLLREQLGFFLNDFQSELSMSPRQQTYSILDQLHFDHHRTCGENIDSIEHMVVCSSCGTTNRIRPHNSSLRPICANCKNYLEQDIPDSSDKAHERLTQIEALTHRIETFVSNYSAWCADQFYKELYQQLVESSAQSDIIVGDIRHLDEIQQKVKELFAIADSAALVNSIKLSVDQIEIALRAYREIKDSLLRWLTPSFYRNRKILRSVLPTRHHSLNSESLSVVDAYLKSISILAFIENKLQTNLEYLSLSPLSLNSKIETRFLFLADVEKRKTFLQLYIERNELNPYLLSYLGDCLTISDCETFTTEAVSDRIREAKSALKSFILHQSASKTLSILVENYPGTLFLTIYQMFKTGMLDECSDYVKHMVELLDHWPKCLQLSKLETELPRPAQRMITKFRNRFFTDRVIFDTWQSNLSLILEARTLCSELDDMQCEVPRSSNIIAKEIQTLESQRFEIVKSCIKTGIHANLAVRLNIRRNSQTLKYFAKVIQKGKKNYASFEELKTSIDYNAIIAALPCWIMSVEDVARIFPLQPGLFDYVVIDESSQCAIPSAIPLLYRAKRAIIVGDNKQLPNADVQYIDGNRNESLLREYRIPNLRFGRAYDCKENSLFDLCNVMAPASTFLNEHFRCYPEIIRFSNEKFYNRRLLMARSSFGNSLGPILNLCYVPNAVDDPSTEEINKVEAEAVITKLNELFKKPEYQDYSFGVLSIFRKQVEYLKELAFDKIDISTREKFHLIVDTADGFQGDERDVILYSFRYAPNSSRNLFNFMETKDGEKRLNVGLTRARNQIFCFVSVYPNDFPKGGVRDFLKYVEAPSTLNLEIKPWDSEFEREVHKMLENHDLVVFPQYKSCGFSIDLVVTNQQGRVLAVECDGWEYHYDDWGQLFDSDIERQNILERAGWRVERICSREFYRNKDKALQPIIEYFFG